MVFDIPGSAEVNVWHVTNEDTQDELDVIDIRWPRVLTLLYDISLKSMMYYMHSILYVTKLS